MEKNIFYHFTRRDAAHQIKREGLTKGVTPVKDEDQTAFLKHTQWLTTVAEQSDQEWTDGYKSRFGVSRTEARVKINIPTPFMGNVMEFQEFCNLFKDHLPDKYNAFPELSKGWYVYFGDIPKAWIANIRFYQE